MGTEFRIDTINTNDWDSLFIVKPYAIIDSNKYNIPKSVLKKMSFKLCSMDIALCFSLKISN